MGCLLRDGVAVEPKMLQVKKHQKEATEGSEVEDVRMQSDGVSGRVKGRNWPVHAKQSSKWASRRSSGARDHSPGCAQEIAPDQANAGLGPPPIHANPPPVHANPQPSLFWLGPAAKGYLGSGMPGWIGIRLSDQQAPPTNNEGLPPISGTGPAHHIGPLGGQTGLLVVLGSLSVK